MTPLYWIQLRGQSIFEQLQLEEALLRSEEANFCIVNFGSPRSIVMGISSRPEVLLDTALVQKDSIPVLRRFSGGGTIIVDESTLFVTWILSKQAAPVPPFPEPILRWSADVYKAAWNIEGFHLRENDYVIHDKKCGGNAQYIRKERWLHHTSFLWDYQPSNMRYLLLPPKRPSYRVDRGHEEFLCKLNAHAQSPEELIEKLYAELGRRFEVTPFDLATWERKPFRQATQTVFD